jgi:hypothetical protein
LCQDFAEAQQTLPDETKQLTFEELLEMVQTFGQHAGDLKELLRAEQAKNKELNTENAGWLTVYQRLQSENAALRAELSRHQSPIRGQQGDS